MKYFRNSGIVANFIQVKPLEEKTQLWHKLHILARQLVKYVSFTTTIRWHNYCFFQRRKQGLEIWLKP
jgi:hypothetical protein